MPSLGWKCPHKSKILTCRECQGNYCSKCIQLEVHFCPKLSDHVQMDKDNLRKKLVKVEAPKITLF